MHYRRPTPQKSKPLKDGEREEGTHTTLLVNVSLPRPLRLLLGFAAGKSSSSSPISSSTSASPPSSNLVADPEKSEGTFKSVSPWC